MLTFLKKIIGTAQDRILNKYKKIVQTVNQWDEQFQLLSDEALKSKTDEFKKRITKGETLDQLLPEAYAVVKNVCRRLCGSDVHVSGYDQQWDMIPYDVQIIGAIAMHYGSIAEMQTGEGKTLTAVMPLYLNALISKPVHLVTVNDYLARRDCEWVGSVLRWLNLTTGVLTNQVPPQERKQIYNSDVVYGTASEFGFDYLRDNSTATNKEEQVQRGYFFAIIDETDCILIDEARTPLIISGPVPQSHQMYDELKESVAKLVRMQRDLCNRFATEARKHLATLGLDLHKRIDGRQDEKKSKKDNNKILEALKKLWIVSKGTPHNKILKRALEDPDLREEIDRWDLYFYNEQNKADKAKALAELFIIVDEKANEYELTEKGIEAWAESAEAHSKDDFIMFDLGHEYALIDDDPDLSIDDKLQKKVQISEDDSKRKEKSHNLRQLLRAHLLMEKDIDYIVQNNRITIIDENTGRPQPGRRFSDGLHQSIEAKEMVAIQKETQTYATITLQNFFRMYDKLAGMTGTAITEANELKEIYQLNVLQIPTHVPCKRTDANDEVYMTEREKYHALLKEIRQIHEQERPILIGTESVEVSEKLARILKQHSLPHTVLNAKHHEQEAEIIAAAGKRSSITIATNMAGRGTDIKLEKGIAQLDGLHVIATSRHQSRRIDRQLRGRCARQGDPGSSKFFVSFEDQLMRLFASPKLNTLLKRWRPPEGEPISAGMLNRSIETAQKRIEQRNYTMRKYTIEYDNVINKQRQEIYNFRNDVLNTDSSLPITFEILLSTALSTAEKYFDDRNDEGAWDATGLREWLMTHFPATFEEDIFKNDYVTFDNIEIILERKLKDIFDKKIEQLSHQAQQLYLSHNAEPLENLISTILTSMIVRKIDHHWQQHLLGIDNLRSEVSLRSVGQKDPLIEFKHESFKLFDELTHQLRLEITSGIFKLEITAYQPQNYFNQMIQKLSLETDRSFLPEAETEPQTNAPQDTSPKKEPLINLAPKTGRNDLCPCGSNQKYKKCCGKQLPEQQ